MANPISLSNGLRENIFIFSTLTEGAHQINTSVFSKLYQWKM